MLDPQPPAVAHIQCGDLTVLAGHEDKIAGSKVEPVVLVVAKPDPVYDQGLPVDRTIEMPARTRRTMRPS